MVSDSKAIPYQAVHSFDEAKSFADGIVVLEGDDGGALTAARGGQRPCGLVGANRAGDLVRRAAVDLRALVAVGEVGEPR